MDATFFFNSLLNPAALIPQIIKEWKPYYQAEAFKNYEPEGHKVLSLVHRPDKVTHEQVDDGHGGISTRTITTPVTRTALPIQKIIVTRQTAFLTGGGVTLKAKDLAGSAQSVYDLVDRAWAKNKLDFKNAPLVEDVLSQMECAEIWYSEVKNGAVQMRCKFFSPDDGYQLMPVFDRSGDLIAFGMQYTGLDVDGRERTFFDLYTDTEIYRYVNDSGWVLRNELLQTVGNPIKHKYGKIPVIYWSVPKAAWQDVQSLIDQLEKVISNYGDTNLYNGNPILFAKGELESLPQKESMGKAAATADPNGDLRYVSIDSKPEMVIYEVDTLVRNIYALTQTPDLSFEAMKGLGDISGEALKRLLIDAHLKAIRAQTGWYGEGIQRRINFLIAASESILGVTASDLTITPQFGLFDIDGGAGRIKAAMEANGGLPVMSQKESIEYAGQSENPEQTLADIQGQNQNAA